MKKIAIITARGGSKRIPRKNIKNFLGRPIILYPIEAAFKSKLFDEVMVSTDDDKIADIARRHGAKVPFYRSKENSDDFSTTADVLLEVIQQYQLTSQAFDYMCCIYPTAPFVNKEILFRSFEKIKKNEADSLIPVVKFDYPPQRGLKIKDGKLFFSNPEYLKARSQDLEYIYHDCGQFYWLKTNSFLLQKQIFMKNTMPFEVSKLKYWDIDTIEDWTVAECLYKIQNNF